MATTWIPYACVFLTALFVTLLMTPVAAKIAWALDAVDYPGVRRINRQPVPRMGGIAVFAGIVISFIVQYYGTILLGWETILVPSVLLVGIDYHILALSFFIIFFTGFIDDKYHLKPLQKLIGQLIAAIIAVRGGLVVGSIVNPFAQSALFDLGWLAYPITVIYLVGYVNIFNLIDGLDGLASGIACISGFTLFVLAILAGRSDAATLSIALVGATLGFLRYNFNPAIIFLGDSGSLLLGFTLGVVSLLSVTRVAGMTTVIVPLVIAGMPILDTFSAIIRRFRAGVSIGQADRGHIHHRLLAEGFNQRRAVLTMYAWTALLCIGTMLMVNVSLAPRLAIFVVLMLGSIAFAHHLHLFDPVLLHHYNKHTGEDELITPDDPRFDELKDELVETRRLTLP